MSKTLIIAEIGNNHNGDFKEAINGIMAAKKANADCVKFQMIEPTKFVHSKLRTFNHAKTHKFQIERLQQMQFSLAQFIELSKISRKNNLKFCLSIFDNYLIKKIKNHVDYIKISSGDINNYQLLSTVSKINKPIIISTGASNTKEIKRALQFFPKNKPAILHCVSSYPTPNDSLNLNSIKFLKDKFDNKIGYSDHSKGIEAPIFAVAVGAKIIEKHFFTSLNNTNVGDKAVSIHTDQFKEMVKRIRILEKMLGHYGKDVLLLEKNMKNKIRRSIYYKNEMKKNQIVKESDIFYLRPYNKLGINKMDLHNNIYVLKKNVKSNTIIQSKDFKIYKKK